MKSKEVILVQVAANVIDEIAQRYRKKGVTAQNLQAVVCVSKDGKKAVVYGSHKVHQKVDDGLPKANVIRKGLASIPLCPKHACKQILANYGLTGSGTILAVKGLLE